MMNGVSGPDSDGYNHWSEMKPAQPKSLSPPQPQKQLSDSYSNTLPVRKNVPPKNSYASGEASSSPSSAGGAAGVPWGWLCRGVRSRGEHGHRGCWWWQGSDRQRSSGVKCRSCFWIWRWETSGAGFCHGLLAGWVSANGQHFQGENIEESHAGRLLPLPRLVGDAKSGRSCLGSCSVRGKMGVEHWRFYWYLG